MRYPKIDVRADQELLDRVDALAVLLSHPGAELSRSAAARAAMIAGLEVLEAQHAPKAAAPAPPAKKGHAPADRPVTAKKNPKKK